MWPGNTCSCVAWVPLDPFLVVESDDRHSAAGWQIGGRWKGEFGLAAVGLEQSNCVLHLCLLCRAQHPCQLCSSASNDGDATLHSITMGARQTNEVLLAS